MDSEVVGGAGISLQMDYPGAFAAVKMYLSPAARGIGAGKKLIAQCVSLQSK
jgi:hypothetical protein